MQKAAKAVALAGLFAAFAAPASATIIDNFTTGSESFVINGGTGSLEDQGNGSAPDLIGGQRDTLLSITSNPFNRRIGFDVATDQGMAFLASGSGVSGFLQLDYDGNDAEGNDGFQSRGDGLNADFSGDSGISFDFDFSDSPVLVEIFAETYGPGGSGDIASTSSATLLAGATLVNNTYTVDFSSFGNNTNGGVDFANVDRLVFRFTPQDSATDFTLTSIRTNPVPEPASMAAIGMGLIGICARRRRK